MKESDKPGLIVDSHIHLWPAGLIHPSQRGRLPLAATETDLLNAMKSAGVDIAIAIPASVHEDNDFVLAAAEASNGHVRAVALIDPWDRESSAELTACADRGVVGIRINPRSLARHTSGDYGALAEVIDAAAALNLVVQWTVRLTSSEAIALAAARQPELRHVLDHMGLPEVVENPTLLAQLRSLAEIPRLHVKLSGFYALSQTGYPYRDVWSWAEEVVRAFGIDRCLWASDWPLCSESADYVAQRQLVEQLPFLNGEARLSLLSTTPTALWHLQT